jgi:16S rRNA (cytosine1402-N4)-methyltransferase
MPKQKHVPVLIQEVLGCLNPKLGQNYLDLTAGFGGHAAAIINITGAPQRAVLVDRDQNAIADLEQKFRGQRTTIVKSDFLSTLQTLASESQKFDMILADLGVSSPHLQEAERGFSFSRAGPLDMRMDQTQTLSADHIVNQKSAHELASILRTYGEEAKAEAITKAIVANRPIKDTAQLATIIAKTVGFRRRHGKIHPATKSFQAIRLAVNDELGQLEQSLPLMVDLLAPGGRLAIISFHSLEDRLVKQFFADRAGNTYDAELTLLTKKPIVASHSEIVSNPRARSAKLRAVAKIKNQKKG